MVDVNVPRRREPVAAVVAYDRLVESERAEADLKDLALVLTRAMTDNGRRTSLEDVSVAFGHTRARIEDLPED